MCLLNILLSSHPLSRCCYFPIPPIWFNMHTHCYTETTLEKWSPVTSLCFFCSLQWVYYYSFLDCGSISCFCEFLLPQTKYSVGNSAFLDYHVFLCVLPELYVFPTLNALQRNLFLSQDCNYSMQGMPGAISLNGEFQIHVSSCFQHITYLHVTDLLLKIMIKMEPAIKSLQIFYSDVVLLIPGYRCALSALKTDCMFLIFEPTSWPRRKII